MGQSKLEKVRALVKARQIALDPPATLETVRRIEARYQIRLPQEYVQFVTAVGNGGILPDSSGLKQCACFLYPIEQCRFEKAAGVFPYQASRDDRYAPDVHEGEMEAAQNGRFAFAAPDKGEGYRWELIVNGPCRGEVWAFTDWKMCRGKSVDFLDWVLDCVERGFGQERYDDPEDTALDGMDARLAKLRDRLKRKKAVLKPAVPAERLLEMEQSGGFRLPREYARFLTEIGNGFGPSGRAFDKFLYPLKDSGLERLGKPFPLREARLFAVKQGAHSGMEWLSAFADGIGADVRQGSILLAWEKKRNTPIEQAYLLVVTGAGAGEIWRLSCNPAKGRGDCAPLGSMSFLDWLEAFVNGFQF